MITANPSINDLLLFIRKIPKYPISAKDVAQLAKDKGADSEVVEFYESFPDRAVFDNKEDLVTRTESIEVMARDDQPHEILTSPEED